MNSAAIAKPSDRTLGGIVSDSDAKMPGTSSDERPGHGDVHRDRDAEVRRQREHGPAAGDDRAEHREHAQAEARDRGSMSRAASGMPSRIATICAGSAHAATTPRWKSPRWKTCS